MTSEGNPIAGTSTHDAEAGDGNVNDVTCMTSLRSVCTPTDRAEFNRRLVESFVTGFRMTTKSDDVTVSRYDVTSSVYKRHNQTWFPSNKLHFKKSVPDFIIS